MSDAVSEADAAEHVRAVEMDGSGTIPMPGRCVGCRRASELRLWSDPSLNATPATPDPEGAQQ